MTWSANSALNWCTASSRAVSLCTSAATGRTEAGSTAPAARAAAVSTSGSTRRPWPSQTPVAMSAATIWFASPASMPGMRW